MITKVKVEKNIPMPEIGRYKGGSKFPLREMEIGDSFYMEGNAGLQRDIISFAHRVRPKKFTTRKEKNGYRCWRIK